MGIFQTYSNAHLNRTPIVEKQIKGRQCPWLSADIKIAMNDRDKMLRKVRKTNKEYDWMIYKTLKNRCNNKIKYAKKRYHNELLHENVRNPKKFWKTIKDVFPSKEKPTMASVYSSQADRLTRANSFCQFFSNVAANIKSKAMPLKEFNGGPLANQPTKQKLCLLSLTSPRFSSEKSCKS